MTEKTEKRPILVPVDFSPHAEAALLHACELAHCTGSPLLVLHVVHDPNEMPGYYAKLAKKKMLTRIEDIAEEMLDEFLANVAKQHPELKELKKPGSALVTGIPTTRILEYVDKVNARMVVMGSKGQTGLKHLFVGSIAEHIVQLCPVPVTIVKSKQKK